MNVYYPLDEPRPDRVLQADEYDRKHDRTPHGNTYARKVQIFHGEKQTIEGKKNQNRASKEFHASLLKAAESGTRAFRHRDFTMSSSEGEPRARNPRQEGLT